jgi:ABC-2 type transport system permease protein
MHALRVLGWGWAFHAKMMTRSAFDGLLAVLWPLFFATVAFFMFRSGGDPELLVHAALGAAVMGVWTATSVPASSALQRARWHGVLELLVATPVHFSLVLLPVTVATSAIGLYCLAATIIWGKFVFGIDLPMEQPFAFAVAIPLTVIAVGMFGFLLAVAFVRFRRSWAMGAVLEYPVWLICGFLVPLSLLPGWVQPISWALAPTWGMNAIRQASTGGSPWPDIALCFALGLGYVGIGVLVLDVVLRSAREHATLALT